MKLLMITRKVDQDDALAGFAYNWIKKIAKKTDSLKVICLEKGNISGLPENVEIYSLNRDKYSRSSRLIRRLALCLNFQKLAWQLTPTVDGVFCHMNPEYTILIAPYAKLFKKKIVSWYTHKAVTWRLKLMEKLADAVLTASPESFRLPSKKVKVVGHGIDVEKFKPSNVILSPPKADEESRENLAGSSRRSTESGTPQDDKNFIILSVGRISPTKDYETLIKAADILQNKLDFKIKIIGSPGLAEQASYFFSLKEMVEKMNLREKVEFVGAVPHREIASYFKSADLFVNLSDTGSLDKAVLEAMASGALVLTSNEAFSKILPTELMVEKNQPEILAQKILWVFNLNQDRKKELSGKLRQIVVESHNLDKLVEKIIEQFI
ncbi:MAG: glycosyltransferase family 4 protein [bacterium]